MKSSNEEDKTDVDNEVKKKKQIELFTIKVS